MVENWQVGMLVTIPNDAGMILVCDTWRVVDVDIYQAKCPQVKLQPLAHDGSPMDAPSIWYPIDTLRNDMYVREDAPW
jgi:hypothetical protein